MRKNFIILLFTLFSILPNFSHANQNPDVINQQRNVEFMNMMGQIEFDKRRAQEAEAARQRQAQQPYVEPDINIVRSVFVWNDETGNCYYLPCASQEKGMFAKRAVVKRAQETYKKLYGEEPNRYIDWDCGMAAITMGVSKKTGKIEAYVDTDIKAWIKNMEKMIQIFLIKLIKMPWIIAQHKLIIVNLCMVHMIYLIIDNN